MNVFDEICVDKGTHFEVLCELTGHPVTKENAHVLYDFIANVRRLPKTFTFFLDARRGSLLNFTPFIPQILIEAKKGGVSKCLSTEILIPDLPLLREFFVPIFTSVAGLTDLRLTIE